MDEDRAGERKTFGIGLKNRLGRSVFLKRIQDFTEAGVSAFGKVHFLEKLPDPAIAVTPIENVIVLQSLFGNRTIRAGVADDLDPIGQNANLDRFPDVVTFVINSV